MAYGSTITQKEWDEIDKNAFGYKDRLSKDKKDQTFATFVSKGVHHSNWYDIYIPVPQNVINLVNASGVDGVVVSQDSVPGLLNDYCISVALPTQTIESREMYAGGEAIAVPQKRSYERFATRFYVSDRDSALTYRIFTTWLDFIYNPRNKVFGYYNDFICDITLQMKRGSSNVYGASNNPKGFVGVCREAYPTSVDSIDLNGDNGTTPSTFSVTWVYRYFDSRSAIASFDFYNKTMQGGVFGNTNPVSTHPNKQSSGSVGNDNGYYYGKDGNHRSISDVLSGFDFNNG